MAKLTELFGRKGEEPERRRAARPSRQRQWRRPPHLHRKPSPTLARAWARKTRCCAALLPTPAARSASSTSSSRPSTNLLPAVQRHAARARAGKVANAQPRSACWKTRARPTRRCATNSIRSRRRRPRLEAEAERLREDLELVARAGRALESSGIELSNEISTRTTQIAELERQLEQETSQRRSLSENRRTLQEQLDGAEKRIVELEGELAAAREKLALLDDEKHSLQIAVDQGLNEIARLTRRLTESENTLTATRAQLGKVEVELRRSLWRARSARRRPRRGQRPASGRAQLAQHAARCSAVARGHRRTAPGRGASEPDRPYRRSARLRPQIGGGDHRAQQLRKAPRPARGRARGARAPDQGSRAGARGAVRAQQRHGQDAEDARNGAHPRRGEDRVS